jgi:hypothetical protein
LTRIWHDPRTLTGGDFCQKRDIKQFGGGHYVPNAAKRKHDKKKWFIGYQTTGLSNGQCDKWVDNVSEYDVLVLDAGQWGLEQNERIGFYNASSQLVAKYAKPGALVYFRSTIAGHANCDKLKKPFQSLHEAEEYVSIHPFFSSASVKPANTDANNIFGRNFAASTAEFKWLDIYTASVQHGNLHKNPPDDCLHYPGTLQTIDPGCGLPLLLLTVGLKVVALAFMSVANLLVALPLPWGTSTRYGKGKWICLGSAPVS